MNKTELIDKLLHLGNTTEMCSSTDRHNAKELAHTLIDEYLEAINYTHCCESDSELLPYLEKKKLVDDAYWLNLQNLSGREDFEEAFRLGIETGVDEVLEKLQG